MTVTIVTCDRTPSYLTDTVNTIPADYDIQYICQGEIELPRPGEIIHTDRPYASDDNRHRDGKYNYAQSLLHTKDGLVIEDDVIFARNFDLYIQWAIKAVPSKRYAIALYSCYDWSESPMYSRSLVDYPVEKYYGTQAMLYDLETAREFGNYLQENIEGDLWDLALKTFITQVNPEVKLYATRGSIVQHIGNVSSISTNGHRAFNFVGDI